MQIYQVNMKGILPYYTTDEAKALNQYAYIKRHVTNACSMRRLRKKDFMKKIYSI